MTQSAESRPEPIDVFVGGRIAARRRELGLSQSDLARALSITFQQVQKYERGVNRVSASKLWATARFLGVPVQELFPDGAETAAQGEVQAHATVEGIAEAIRTLSPEDRMLVFTLARRLRLERRAPLPGKRRELVDA